MYRYQKPKTRHRLRLFLGRIFYTVKRYALWYFGRIKFARFRQTRELPHTHISHATPLLRKLKDVDMRLQYNKITNLRLAVARLNGVVLHPGETFSYWRLIGRPTARKGYLPGMVLKSGRVTVGVGGGLCQLSNLIYWLTLHTPLTVTERHRHGYDVFPDADRTQPFGSGATCFYNYGDLMIKNETAAPFQLLLEVGEHDLRGSWKSGTPPAHTYEIYEKDHLMRSEFGGHTRHNRIFRRKFKDGVQIADEFITENHAIMMYSPMLTEKI